MAGHCLVQVLVRYVRKIPHVNILRDKVADFKQTVQILECREPDDDDWFGAD